MMERTDGGGKRTTPLAGVHLRSLQREEQPTLADAAGERAKAVAPALRVSNARLLGKVGREEIYDAGR